MWSQKSYTVTEKSALVLQGIELSYNSKYHMPCVSAVSKMTLTTACCIEIGDVLFCVNNVYINPTKKEVSMFDEIESVIKSQESCTMRLIRENDITLSKSPFFQIIIVDDKLHITVGRSITKDCNVIQRVNKVSCQYLTGSILCGMNELNVLSTPSETVGIRLSNRRLPLVLLMATPIHTSLITQESVDSFMKTYAEDLIAAKSDIQSNMTPVDPSDPFRTLVDINNLSPKKEEIECSPERDESDSSSQWYVEEADEGVDQYMFPRTMGYLVLEKQYKNLFAQSTPDRDRRWDAFIKRIGGVEALSYDMTRQSGHRWKIINVTQQDRNRDELRQLIHEGIPEYIRGDVWYHVSGGFELRQSASKNYSELCKMEVDESVKRMVSLDIPRTFANNRLFGSGDKETPYMTMLRSILFAISQTRTDIKYCQGLNYIAALLLLVQHDEEMAFWTLLAIMEHLFPKDYFNEQLTGARIDQKVMEMLVKKQIPDLQEKLKSGGFELVVFTLPWFICLFINTLPFITVMRVWDVIMFEGDKALIRIALALLSVGEKDLLACSEFSEFSSSFRQLGMLLFDADNLLDVAYQKTVAEGANEKVVFFRRKELEKWRNTIRKEM